MPFATKTVEFKDREHAKLWIGLRQLGRRNLRDDQRAIVANDVREIRSKIAMTERARKANLVKHGKYSSENTPFSEDKPMLS